MACMVEEISDKRLYIFVRFKLSIVMEVTWQYCLS